MSGRSMKKIRREFNTILKQHSAQMREAASKGFVTWVNTMPVRARMRLALAVLCKRF